MDSQNVRPFAKEIAKRFSGVSERFPQGLTSLGALYRVKTIFREMELHIHVGEKKQTIWVQNFRIGDRFPMLAFSVNRPDRASRLDRPRDTGLNRQVFINDYVWCDLELVRRFCDENKAEVDSLNLAPEDSLSIQAGHIRLRLQTTDIDRILEALEPISRIFHRYMTGHPVKLLSERAHRLVLSKKFDAALQKVGEFGGTISDSPLCKACELPIHHLATIELSKAVPLDHPRNLDEIDVLFCLRCQTFAGPTYVDFSGDRPVVMSQESGPTFMDVPEVLPSRAIGCKPIKTRAQGGHKIGGSPDWIQGPDVPSCPKCEAEMEFVLQFKTDDALNVQFADDGLLFCFVCDSCRVVATQTQSM